MTKPQRYRSKVLQSIALSASAYELTIERQGLVFDAGKEIQVHGADPTEDRTYSVVSGEEERDIVLLYRLIPEGKLTPKLVQLKPGDAVEFTGPFGSFTLRDKARPIVFVATGTGIAPCVSFVRTCPELNLTVLHGVRTADDLFYQNELSRYTYYPCLSREDGQGFRGRVTDLIPSLSFPPECHFYLCGANEMIMDVRKLLKTQVVEDGRIFSEAYFFW